MVWNNIEISTKLALTPVCYVGVVDILSYWLKSLVFLLFFFFFFFLKKKKPFTSVTGSEVFVDNCIFTMYNPAYQLWYGIQIPKTTTTLNQLDLPLPNRNKEVVNVKLLSSCYDKQKGRYSFAFLKNYSLVTWWMVIDLPST